MEIFFFFWQREEEEGRDEISCKTQQIYFTSFLFLPCLSFSLLRASEVAPYLQGDGLRRQVALEGNRLVLTCLAGGSWPLQYRWTLNNSNLTDWTPRYRSVVTHPRRISLRSTK